VEARAILARSLKLAPEVIAAHWPDYDVTVEMGQRLPDQFDSNARTIAAADPNFKGKPAPDFRKLMAPGFLREVAPERVEKGM
jgi:hypothetical protein